MSPSWDLIPESQLEPRAAHTETQPDVRKRQRRGRKLLVTDKAEMVQLEKETRRKDRQTQRGSRDEERGVMADTGVGARPLGQAG